MKYLTRDNITLMLSIIGSVGTLLSCLSKWLNSRKNIKMSVVKFCKSRNLLIAYILVNNNSSAPIILNRVSAKCGQVVYPCYEIPHKIFTFENRVGNELKSSKDYYSIQFPINLTPCSGTSGYFAFEIPQEQIKTLSTPLILQVSSNRGKAFEIELDLKNEVSWDKMS